MPKLTNMMETPIDGAVVVTFVFAVLRVLRVFVVSCRPP